MITSTFLWFFTIKEDAVRSDVTRIVYHPIVWNTSVSDCLRFYSALKDKPVVSTIKLKTLSVTLSSCINIWCAVNSFSHNFPSFFCICQINKPVPVLEAYLLSQYLRLLYASLYYLNFWCHDKQRTTHQNYYPLQAINW